MKQNAWENVNIDLFGPMPDNKHVLVVTDSMSRFPAAKIVPSTAATPVLKALGGIYTDFGQPKSHRTDNGPPFDSEAFKDFSEKAGVTHIKTFPYHPQANPAETFMKPLGKSMKIAQYNRLTKEQCLDQLLSSYRATPHIATGQAPGSMMLRGGYKSDFPGRGALSDREIERAKEKDSSDKSTRTEQLNKSTHRKQHDVAIGTRIYTRNHKRTKFMPVFDPTPRTVTEVEKGGVTCIDEAGTEQRRHMDDIKEAVEPCPLPV